LRAVLVLSLVAFAACSTSDGEPRGGDEPAEVDCSSLESVPTFGDLQRGILPTCLRCHSAQVTGARRNDAPEGVNFDTYEELATAAEIASYMVESRLMPSPDGEGPTEAQRRELYEWTACG
jgi:uncharacterized membrane protein